jgi:hypothetical protein
MSFDWVVSCTIPTGGLLPGWLLLNGTLDAGVAVANTTSPVIVEESFASAGKAETVGILGDGTVETGIGVPVTA